MLQRLIQIQSLIVLIEPEVDELELESEVVAELVPLQEEFSSRPTEVEEISIETFVNFSAEPTMELVPSLATMRSSLYLKLLNVYDPLQIL